MTCFERCFLINSFSCRKKYHVCHVIALPDQLCTNARFRESPFTKLHVTLNCRFDNLLIFYQWLHSCKAAHKLLFTYIYSFYRLFDNFTQKFQFFFRQRKRKFSLYMLICMLNENLCTGMLDAFREFKVGLILHKFKH